MVEGMTMDTAPRPYRWRTSSYSSNGTNCIEVSHDPTAVRDSKNPEGRTLPVDLRLFVNAIQGGQFDR
jgi:hypothetical protein